MAESFACRITDTAVCRSLQTVQQLIACVLHRYRDTYLNIGTDEYRKCNAAYSFGGADPVKKVIKIILMSKPSVQFSM